jgi:hypothetical protein
VDVVALIAEVRRLTADLAESQKNSGFWGRAAAKAQNERDEARADNARLRAAMPSDLQCVGIENVLEDFERRNGNENSALLVRASLASLARLDAIKSSGPTVADGAARPDAERRGECDERSTMTAEAMREAAFVHLRDRSRAAAGTVGWVLAQAADEIRALPLTSDGTDTCLDCGCTMQRVCCGCGGTGLAKGGE